MFRVERDLPLGVWRLITNFSLSNATGQYRPTNHAYKISIIGDSKIKDSDFHCDDMFFSFASFEDIEVIGQVESLKDVQTVQVKQKDRKIFEFRLCDTKYKLHIVVWNDSGTCKLMLLDTEAEAIVGCKAVELWDGSYDELANLSVLEFLWKNDNVTNGSDIFMASQIWSGDKLLKAESHSVVSRESSMISGSEVSKSDPNSQTTSEGCSTPFSKRKDGDLPDKSSS
ncbi:hypothetical protein HID58_061254 [Brassica napus]|uniref:DUF223 domain-containing protein n=1 Tax=Brassica napus TaxID=3708 RepID=A0ABQ7ZYU8_BRANA|nr:hypothetical protein HID58_061254 [Brassica napus]